MDEIEFSVPLESAVLIHQAIARIYESARNSSSLGSFKEAVFEQLAELVAFDHSAWHCRSNADIFVDEGETGGRYLQRKSTFELDRRKPKASLMLAQTVFPADVYRAMGMPLNDSSDIGNQLILSVEYGQILHYLCLSRESSSHIFDQYDHDVVTFLFENISRAYEVHLKHRLNRRWRFREGIRAISDCHGRILFAQSDFEPLIKKCLPSNVKFSLTELNGSSVSCSMFLEQGYRVSMTAEEDINLVEIYPDDELLTALDTMTTAEMEVAQLLVKGLTIQAIAQSKGVSPSTVDNQLNSIHKKLGLSKNTEVISYLLKSGYNLIG